MESRSNNQGRQQRVPMRVNSCLSSGQGSHVSGLSQWSWSLSQRAGARMLDDSEPPRGLWELNDDLREQ